MNIIIVGSAAAVKHGLTKREPRDFDLFSADCDSAMQFAESIGKIDSVKETEKGILIHTHVKPIEVELIEKCDNTAQIFHRMKQDSDDGIHASAAWLRFLKESHKFKRNSPHFWKTAVDVHTMRRRRIDMPEDSIELFKERERLTYTYSHPKLDVSKKEFFSNDGVNYVFDHDDIHRVVALDGKPAYTHYLMDGSPVMTDKDKFFACKPKVRMLGFIEESMVLTAERSLIPHNFKPNPHEMFKFSVSKVCSSITSGYFRSWCYDNIFQGLMFYDAKVKNSGWVEKLQAEIQAGTLMKHQ